MSRFIITTIALLMAAASGERLRGQSATDFSVVLGAWEMAVETPRGEMTQTLTFVADRDALTGSATGPNGSVPLRNVSFEEGRLSFQVTRRLRNREITQRYEATIQGDRITGTVSGGRGGSREFTAVRSTT